MPLKPGDQVILRNRTSKSPTVEVQLRGDRAILSLKQDSPGLVVAVLDEEKSDVLIDHKLYLVPNAWLQKA